MLKHGTLVKFASLGCLSLTLGIQSAQAFTIISFNGQAARWNTDSTIQVQYDPNFGSAFNSSGCDKNGPCVTPGEAITSSIKSWKKVDNIYLKIGTPVAKTISGTPKYDGVNEIKMYTAAWQSLPFAPPSSALAVTISTYDNDGRILDADMFINGENFQWGVINSDKESNIHDIQNVVTHEFGHFLGLNHTSENPNESDMTRYNATMYYASLPGETFRRTLDSLDIYGIQHLYTDENMPEPTVDQLSPNEMQVDYKGSATFEIEGDNFLPTTSVVFARNGYDGDIVGRVISVENNKITVSFDMSNMQSGTYDLVVANSYKSYTRTEKAFNLSNSTVFGTYNSDASASTEGSGGGCSSNGSSPLLAIMLGLLLIMPRRVRAKI